MQLLAKEAANWLNLSFIQVAYLKPTFASTVTLTFLFSTG